MAHRLRVNINDETAEALRTLMAEDGLTVTEIVRRSVSVYHFLATEVMNDPSKKLEIVDKRRRTVTSVNLLP